MTRTSANLIDLDQTALETALKTFMRSQSQWKDYDFEGSTLAGLIRLLAHNTYLGGFYTNMIHAEGFLSSAQMRSSILSRSKELNYTPRSARSAAASIRLTFNGTEPSYMLRKGSTFSTTNKNRGFVFSVPENIMMSSSSGVFSQTLTIYEGAYLKETYIMNYANETQHFMITNPNVDTRSITVAVYEDNSTIAKTYRRATSLLGLTETDRVYFLQASENGEYEIVFGDNIIGERPADGATVIIDYRIASGSDVNGARSFSQDFEIGNGTSNIKVETLSNAAGGDVAETIESIRYYAPRHFQVQERAVTAPDYVVLLKTQFPEIRACTAFGGEEANPPLYGRVIIPLDISEVDGIPPSKRDEYYNFLKGRCSPNIEPVFVNPITTYVAVKCDVTYNLNNTTLSPDNIKTLVFNTVKEFAEENLNDFDALLRYSRLSSAIDETNNAIVGNVLDLTVYQKITPRTGVEQNIVIDFAMPILNDQNPVTENNFPLSHSRIITSTGFYTDSGYVFLTDTGDGKMWTAVAENQNVSLISEVGHVDYDTGRIVLSGIKPLAYDPTGIKVYAKPADKNIQGRLDIIVAVEDDEVAVRVLGVRE